MVLETCDEECKEGESTPEEEDVQAFHKLKKGNSYYLRSKDKAPLNSSTPPKETLLPHPPTLGEPSFLLILILMSTLLHQRLLRIQLLPKIVNKFPQKRSQLYQRRLDKIS
jgi:hypothetical protein